MAKKTTTGKNIQNYIQNVLKTSTNSGNAAIAAGYPPESTYTDAYYAGVPYLYMYGDPEPAQALDRMGELYNAYGAAGGYNKTNFGDIEGMYGAAGQYDPTQYNLSDYTAQNIQTRMSPYEELVSDRARKRLKKSYDEAQGERDAQAACAGAFGGSGAAIQNEVSRRNYLEQMADMDAQNLQAAFESGVGLYGKEMADNLAAMQATEASRQYGAGLGLQGLQQQLQAAQQLGTLGQAQFGQQKDIINALQATGAQRQALNQQKLTQDYEDFLRQKQYPYQQLAYAMEMVKGVPQQTTQSVYGAPQSMQAQLGGGLMSAYGLSKLFAEGGLAGLGVYNLGRE